jgi:hypothetical protein
MGNCTPSFLLKVGLAMGVGIILQFPAFAQCTNNLATRSYDTALTSNGFGIYAMSVPQFSPDSGLLVSVKLSATTTSQYGFTLKNADTANAIYSLTLGQEDQFSGAALSSPFTNVMSQFINTYPLTPGQQVVTPSFQFLNGHVSSDSITANTAPFLGTGKVNLSYMSFTYTSLTTTNNSTYYYYSNTIANNLHFTVQYLYCQADIALPATLTRFSAILTSPHTTQLNWAAVNETAGRSYDIQRSSDGREFATIGSIAAQGDESGAEYGYADTLPGNGIGNWYYRLQIHDKDQLSWSPIKEITVSAPAFAQSTPSLSVYPNPATDHTTVNTGGVVDDWQVDVLSANGDLIERTTFLQSAVLAISFRTHLAAGTYFIRLLSLHTSKNYTLPILLTTRS